MASPGRPSRPKPDPRSPSSGPICQTSTPIPTPSPSRRSASTSIFAACLRPRAPPSADAPIRIPLPRRWLSGAGPRSRTDGRSKGSSARIRLCGSPAGAEQSASVLVGAQSARGRPAIFSLRRSPRGSATLDRVCRLARVWGRAPVNGVGAAILRVVQSPFGSAARGHRA